MTIERTLSIIKPDATRRNLTGAINDRFERGGLRIVAQKRIQLSQSQAERFYEVHAGRPFYRDLVAFMSSGPVMVQVLEGENAVALNREIMGATNPANAAPGTIRKDFAEFDRSKLGPRVRFARECGAGDRLLFLHDRNLPVVRAADPSEPVSLTGGILPGSAGGRFAIPTLPILAKPLCPAHRGVVRGRSRHRCSAIFSAPRRAAPRRGRARLGCGAVRGRFGAVDKRDKADPHPPGCRRCCSGVSCCGGPPRPCGRSIRCAVWSWRPDSPVCLPSGSRLPPAPAWSRHHAA